MIVGINARILNTKNIRGWSRYTYNLIRGLADKNIEVQLFTDHPLNLEWIPEKLHGNISIAPGKSYIHWEQVVLRNLAEEHKVDILHCPINYGLPCFGSFKKVLTLHDAIEKSFYRKRMTMLEKMDFTHLKLWIYYYLSHKSADKIITVSESAKKEIEDYYGIHPGKINVIFEAAEELFSYNFVENKNTFMQRWKVDPGYLLYLGGFEERKNIKFLLDMAKRLPKQQFVLVGGGDIEVFKSIPSNVHFTGYVDEKWLPSFYSYSKAFIYPSYHEGFGLQLVEAMALDKPCLYSDRTSLPEIYGSNKWAFDPNDVNSAVEKLKYLEQNYEEAVQFARQRKESFSWEKTVNQTIALYQSLL